MLTMKLSEWIGPVVIGLVTISAIVSLALYSEVNRTYTHHVYADGGGNVLEYLDKYQSIRVNNENLQIHGLCASACTYFLGTVPEEKVCADEYALFGFHGVYTGLRGFNEALTEFYHHYVYPDHIRSLLEEQGFDGSSDVDTNEHPT